MRVQGCAQRCSGSFNLFIVGLALKSAQYLGPEFCWRILQEKVSCLRIGTPAYALSKG